MVATKNEIKTAAEAVMNSYGLSGWTFKWTSSKVEFGFTDQDHHVIEASWKLFKSNGPAEFEDTLIHEISHALLPDPMAAAHGPEWVAKATELGVQNIDYYKD